MIVHHEAMEPEQLKNTCAYSRTDVVSNHQLQYETKEEFKATLGALATQVSRHFVCMTKMETDTVAELEYSQSKTCCWLGSTDAMYETILAVNAQRQEDAEACLEPLVFKAVDGEYAEFQAFAPESWVAYSNDEHCPQGDLPNHNDVEATHDWTNYCEWTDAGGGDDSGGDDSGGDDSGGDDGASCNDRCGGMADSCWCDDSCAEYGDCCDDYDSACG